MSREVCGTCWCPYDDITGECACPPPSVQKSTLREAATKALEFIRHMNQHGWMLADYEADMERTVADLEAALAEPATLDEAMAGPMALAQAYENGWNAAKAEPVEPVAWMDSDGFPWSKEGREMRSTPDTYTPLYPAPPQRKPLTEEEILNIGMGARAVEGPHILPVTFARAIERAHGIGA